MTDHDPAVRDAARDLALRLFLRYPSMIEEAGSDRLRHVLTRLNEHLTTPRRDRISHFVNIPTPKLEHLKKQLQFELTKRESPEYD